MRTLLATANCTEVECNQESWCAFHSMSGFDASFPIHLATVSRQARTMYKTSVVCLLFPNILSCSSIDVMISPQLDSYDEEEGCGMVAVIHGCCTLYLCKGVTQEDDVSTNK